MLRIAVCDDEPIDLSTIVKGLGDILRHHAFEFAITPFPSGTALLAQHTQTPFDVLFLDIDMPGASGFDVAQAVRNLSLKPYVIFVTAKHDLVYRSFEFQPFYFICKGPQTDLQADLAHVVQKLLPLFKQSKLLEIPNKRTGTIHIALSRVLYVHSEKHYLLYHLIEGESLLVKERELLTNRERDLQAYDFLKVHQRYLVNMHHIRRLDSAFNDIQMANGDVVPMSAQLKGTVFEKYQNFMRR